MAFSQERVVKVALPAGSSARHVSSTGAGSQPGLAPVELPLPLEGRLWPADPLAHSVTLVAMQQTWLRVFLLADGRLVFAGLDRNPRNPWQAEFEYTITIASRHVPRLADTLRRRAGVQHLGERSADILGLLRIHRGLVEKRGEKGFLADLGIPFSYRSRVGGPLNG